MFEQQLRRAAEAGFLGVEITFRDLCSYANRSIPGFKGEQDIPSLLTTAEEIRGLCEKAKVQIACLHAPTDINVTRSVSERSEKMAEVERLLLVMKGLGTATLLVESFDDPHSLARDLAYLCQLTLENSPRSQIAYKPKKSLGGGIDNWKKGWEVIDSIKWPNIGLVVDILQVTKGEQGDLRFPASLNEGHDEPESDPRFETEVDELIQIIPAEKIYRIQIPAPIEMVQPVSEESEPPVKKRRLRDDGQTVLASPLGSDLVKLVLRKFGEGEFRGWVKMEISPTEDDSYAVGNDAVKRKRA